MEGPLVAKADPQLSHQLNRYRLPSRAAGPHANINLLLLLTDSETQHHKPLDTAGAGREPSWRRPPLRLGMLFEGCGRGCSSLGGGGGSRCSAYPRQAAQPNSAHEHATRAESLQHRAPRRRQGTPKRPWCNHAEAQAAARAADPTPPHAQRRGPSGPAAPVPHPNCILTAS